MTDISEKCPLCESEALVDHGGTENPLGMRKFVRCSRCGQFTIVRGSLSETAPKQRHLISGFVREANIRNMLPPMLTSASATNILQESPRDDLARADRFVLNIHRLTENKSDAHYIDKGRDFPLAYCRDKHHLSEIISLLREDKLIKMLSPTSAMKLTAAGLRRAHSLLHGEFSASKQCFVAMSFDESLTWLFDDCISPVTMSNGFDPVRMDRKHHNDNINNRVFEEINSSRFMIAEFTGHNNGVYFEVGYALGKNIPVIWCCRKSDFKGAHFDTSPYNHILWDTPDQLSLQLSNRIRETINMSRTKIG